MGHGGMWTEGPTGPGGWVCVSGPQLRAWDPWEGGWGWGEMEQTNTGLQSLVV